MEWTSPILSTDGTLGDLKRLSSSQPTSSTFHEMWMDSKDAVNALASASPDIDPATGREALVRESFEIPANGTLDLGEVAWEGQGVLLIEAMLGGKPFRNNFLYGEIPFDYKAVKALLPGYEADGK